MAKVGLSKAAELSGKSASTIHRAMSKGRLSYEADENGTRLVDTAELARVFGIHADAIAGDSVRDMLRTSQLPTHASDIVQLRADLSLERLKSTMLEERVRELIERIDDLRVERDEWRANAQTLLLSSRSERAVTNDLAGDVAAPEERALNEKRRRHWWHWALLLL
jgi:hypothetical protein